MKSIGNIISEKSQKLCLRGDVPLQIEDGGVYG